MVVRRTDLKNAVDDFRMLASLGSYRSVSSTMAKKQGYYVFGQDRMIEFWTNMQEAYRVVDPKFTVNAGEGTVAKTGKKKERESSESGVAKKRMRF
jgi:hypothetical protein